MSRIWLPQPVRGGGAGQPPSRMGQRGVRDTYHTSRHTMAPPAQPPLDAHYGQEADVRSTPGTSYLSLPSTGYHSARYDDELDEFDRDLLEEPVVPSVNANDVDGYDFDLRNPARIQGSHTYHTHAGSKNARHSYSELEFAAPVTYADEAHHLSPRAQVLLGRDPTHRLQELRASLQQETPPIRSAAYGRTPLSQGSTGAGYAVPASSSPTTRVTVRRQQPNFVPTSSSPPASTGSSARLPERMQSQQPGSTPVVQGIPLINLVQVLSDKLRTIFPFELLNAVQSKCFEVIYNTNDNVVVAAPTGSGKTALLELAICKLALGRGKENFKIVYQAPTKALCSEKARDWETKFSHMSLKCAELTGDTSQAEMRRVGDASIIVTTPEKWDSITRKWHDHRRLLQMVELFLIDEVHILKDVRGATLEAVVSRMKTIGANVRFIALSATVPNSEDIAQWLGRNHTNQQLPAHRETFGEEFRPVKLEKFVYGYQSTGNDFVFDRFLDGKLPALLSRHSHKKPILIFCFTRKSCESTASMLAEYVSGRPQPDELWPMPTKRVAVINRSLQEIVRFGVAFHHAGLDVQDRNAVEQSFLKGQLSVICCTSTLAVGVNLPCHTAVLKGTVGFTDDNIQEFSDLEVMQMLGRAGRPQFDDSATAIILTRAHNKQRYERMVSGQEILESTLHLNLIEHLNSEVCLGTVNDLQSAKTWLAGTFLSVRLRRNPKHYNMTGGMSNPMQIDDKLEEICERDVKLLQEAELVTDGDNFKCTDYGRSMSRYMVEFTTMKNLLQIPRAVGMEALITALSQASEFREFRFKPAERTIFRDVNQSQLIMYPVKEVVNQTWHKIFLMVQAELGSVQYTDSGEGAKLRRQLMMEKKMIFERLQRLVRAVIDCKGHDRDATGVRNALELARALSAESWEGRATQLTQVPNIGPAGMRKLASKGIRSVLELADKEPDEIERLMSRQPPFGRKIKEDLDKFPRLALDVAVAGHKLQPRQKEEPVVINVVSTIRYLNRKTAPNWLGKSPLLTFFAEFDDGALVYFWRGSMRKVDKQAGLELKFSVSLRTASDHINCHLSCEEIVGTAVSKVLKHGLSEAVFPREQRASAPSAPVSNRQRSVKEPEYLDDDGIEECDLIEAAEQAVSSLARGRGREETNNDEDYPPVEDFMVVSETHRELERRETASQDFDDRLAAQQRNEEIHPENDQEVWSEPVQLPSGRWRCNHACSGGALTKSGKPCTHRCCKEGLDKPRKRPAPKPKKRKEDEFHEADTIEALPVVSASKSGPKSGLQQLNTQPARGSTGPPPKRQKPASETPKVLGSTGNGIQKYLWKKVDLNDLFLDVVDLSQVDDEPGRYPKTSTPAVQEITSDDEDAMMDFPEFPPMANSPVQKSKKPPLGNSHNAALTDPAPDHTTKEIPDLLETQDFEELLESGQYDVIVDTATANPPLPGFRSGAKDEVFYQKVDEHQDHGDGSAHSQYSSVNAENLPLMMSDDLDYLFDEEIAMDDIRSSKASVSRGAGVKSTSTIDPGGSIVVASKEPARPTAREGEPDWVAEFDPEFVDLFRGYVKFV